MFKTSNNASVSCFRINDWQLHNNTEKCRSEEIRCGAIILASALNNPLPKLKIVALNWGWWFYHKKKKRIWFYNYSTVFKKCIFFAKQPLKKQHLKLLLWLLQRDFCWFELKNIFGVGEILTSQSSDLILDELDHRTTVSCIIKIYLFTNQLLV